jgi:hypothetical protein
MSEGQTCSLGRTFTNWQTVYKITFCGMNTSFAEAERRRVGVPPAGFVQNAV